MQRAFFFLAFVCAVTIASAAEKPTPDLFGRLRVRLLDATGVELKLVAEEIQTPSHTVQQEFQFKDGKINALSCFDPASRTVVYRVETPLLESGEVGIGFQFPKENRLPPMSVDGNRATFSCKRGKTTIGWTDSATLTAPKPRRYLQVSLAEYGANTKWKDVTETVRDLIIGDSLEFRAGNTLFGDPIGGVPKNFSITYSIGDGDEKFETFNENHNVRIQFDPKDQFFRLNVGKRSVFEFVVAVGSIVLPEKLPTFADAKKHASAFDRPPGSMR